MHDCRRFIKLSLSVAGVRMELEIAKLMNVSESDSAKLQDLWSEYLDADTDGEREESSSEAELSCDESDLEDGGDEVNQFDMTLTEYDYVLAQATKQVDVQHPDDQLEYEKANKFR